MLANIIITYLSGAVNSYFRTFVRNWYYITGMKKVKVFFGLHSLIIQNTIFYIDIPVIYSSFSFDFNSFSN